MRFPRFRMDWEMFVVAFCGMTIFLSAIPTDWGVRFLQHKIEVVQQLKGHPMGRLALASVSGLGYALTAGLRKRRRKVDDVDIRLQFQDVMKTVVVNSPLTNGETQILLKVFMAGVNTDRKVFPKWWDASWRRK